jgi:hypothetical protein
MSFVIRIVTNSPFLLSFLRSPDANRDDEEISTAHPELVEGFTPSVIASPDEIGAWQSLPHAIVIPAKAGIYPVYPEFIEGSLRSRSW